LATTVRGRNDHSGGSTAVVFLLEPRDQLGGGQDLSGAGDSRPLPQISFQAFGLARSPERGWAEPCCVRDPQGPWASGLVKKRFAADM
jgi:hypothetical protein